MSYIAVSYFTENTSYAEEIKNLVDSLEKFSIPSDIVSIPSQGGWQANTQYKAYFCKQMLIRHYPKDILFLDADAVLKQHPTIFDHIDYDIAVHFRDDWELVDSTLYLANNAKVSELVERWIISCLENPNTWVQKLLQYTLYMSLDLNLRMKTLPPTYCKIFDTMTHVENPVIEQFQASRRFKKEVGL